MAQQKNAPENLKSSSPKKSHPPYILIVEDEPAHSTLIRHALRAANPNAVVKVADSLKEYRSAIAVSLPEIVLMDVNLPDGKALEALTASPDAGLFPIVVMTSYGNEKLAVKAMKAGAIDYIVKSPETYTAIAQTIERALREWKLLQERKQAEEALTKSELRFRSLYENVAIGLYRTTPAGKILLANQTLVKMLGYSSFEKLAERNLSKVGFEQASQRNDFLKKIETEGEVRDFESTWVRQDSSVLFVRESARAIRDAQGKTMYYDGAVEDITAYKLAEAAGRHAEAALQRVSRLYATLSHVNHTIVRVKNREKLFEAICRIAVEFGQFRMAWIGLADEQSGQVKPLTHCGYEAGYLQTVTINISKESPFGKGPSGVALREGRIVINDNSQVDPKMSPWRNEALKRGYLSSAAVPFHFKGQVIGLLNLYATESGFFTEEEQRLLVEIGDNISFALDSMAVETERKQAEEALTSSESRFRKVYSEGLVPMAFLNQNFQFTQVNEPFEKMLGYTEAELKRMTFREVTHPENIQQDLEHVQKLLRGELEVYTTEKRYIAKDKEIRWGFVNVGVLKDAIGAFLSFVVMIVDVTERKRMEESLRASGDRLHLALESANSGAWEWDLLTNENIWSDELWKLYGLEPHSCIPTYETWRQTIHPHDREFAEKMVQEAARTESELNAEWRVVDRDRTVRWLLSRGRPLRDANGKAVRFIGIVSDITNRKRVEDALHQSEEIFRHFMENSPVYVFFKDENIRAIRLSKNFETMLGKPMSELLGKNMDDLFPSELARSMVADDRRILNEGEKITVEEELHGRHYSTIKFPIIVEGKPRFLAGYTIDITERKLAEEALQKSHSRIVKLTAQVPGVVYQYRLYPDGRSSFPFASPGMNDIYEVSPEDVREDATPVFGRLHPDDYDRIVFDIQESARTLEPFHCEFRVVLPRQGLRWRLSDAIPERTEDGGTLWYGIISDINERKKAEELLKQSETKYRLLADHMKDTIWLMDMNLKTTYISPSVEKLRGYTLEEIRQLPLDQQFTPASFQLAMDAFSEEMSKVMADPTYFILRNLDLEFFRKDGTTYWSENRFSLIRDENGSPISIMGEGRDITERKRVEEALRESEIKYRDMVEQINDVIYAADLAGILTYISPTAEGMGGYTPEEMIGRSIGEFIDPVFLPKIKEQFQKVISGIMESTEYRIKTKSGEFRWVRSSSKPILKENKPIGVRGVLTDINAQKQVEEVVTLLSHTVKSISECVSITDLKNRVLYVNQAFLDLYGYFKEEVIGKSIGALVVPGGSDIPEILPTTLKGGWHGEIINRKKDGTEIPIFLSTSVVYDDTGKAIALVGIATDITERKRVEEELERNEKKLHDLFETAPVGYHEIDEQGNITAVNKTELNMLGYSYAQMIGWPAWEFVTDTEESKRRVLEKLGGTLPANKNSEQVFTRKDGTMFPAIVDDVILRNEQGTITGIRTTILDITKRKQAEEALRESQALYHSLVDQMPAGVFRKDSEGRYVFVSPWYCQHKNIKQEELLGKTPKEFAVYEAAKQNMSELSVKYSALGEDHHRVIMQTGKSIEMDEEYPNADGTKQFVHAIKMPVVNSDGKIVGTQGILVDITKLKQAEENNRKLSSAVEQSGSSIVITNLRGDIEYVNPKFIELTGYSAQESIGKNPRILKSGYTSDEEYKKLWNTITNGGVWQGEFQNKKKNGDLYWESTIISPVRDSDGKITHFIGVKEDITRQRVVTEQLRQMQKMEGLGTLAGGIAHDFNNILGIILAYISSLKRFKGDTKKFDLATETIEKAVDRGKTLVQQILTFARKTDTEFGSVNVNEVVMEMMTMAMGTFPKILTYAQNIDKNIGFIKADRSQLHQALLNLCVNARDAMPSGGVLSINTRMMSSATLRNAHPDALESSYVCLEVRDTGEGMDEVVKKRIFEPFFTTKGIGKGTGLGLAVVFGVVQSHKGFIDVESERGKGTAFRLYLPALQADAPLSEKSEEMMQEIKGGTETLLVVEDEEMLMMSLRMVLVEKGYNVISAGDGLAAVNMYKERVKEIALVLTDLGLPKLTGMEECAQIKKFNPNVRMIVATGFLDPEMKSELLKLRIQHFLYKPYDLMKVLKMVREVLDGK